jgi:hypothetical protein
MAKSFDEKYKNCFRKEKGRKKNGAGTTGRNSKAKY